MLTLYFSAMFLLGEAASVGRYARCGWLLLKTRLQGDKGTGGCLFPESRKALTGWEKPEPDGMRDALPMVA